MVSYLEILFWICLLLVIYTYVGYGVLMVLLVKLKEFFGGKTPRPELSDEDLPELTLFITAFNEEDIVTEKMSNTLALDYPKDKLRILWVTDGSTDQTVARLGDYTSVEVQHSTERRGKTAAINRGMQFVNTPLVVFSDANSMLNLGSLRVIAELFARSEVGCVSGEKRIAAASDADASAKGESAYWRYESALKSLDSRFYSAVGAAGELFAIRTRLFEPMAHDTLLDDFILSMKIAQQGYRIAYTAEAYAVENGSLNIEEEAKRKRRICAGGLQSIARLLPLLNVFKYGRLSFLYISHRVLRWSVTPIALFMLLPLNAILASTNGTDSDIYRWILVLQVLFYLSAGYGYILNKSGKKSKIFYISYYFVFMNANVFRGIFYLLNKKDGVWEKSVRR